MKSLIFILFIPFYLFCADSMALKQQNVLYVQKLIESEELISKNFEKYILEKLEIPTIAQLKANNYLGTNFILTNKFGSDLSFKSVKELKLNYAISNDVDEYIKLLYNRDLYRNLTEVYEDASVSSNSYTLIKLQSPEAINIFKLLSSGESIASTCNSSLNEQYCNLNEKSIRWYNASSKWIEYNKKDFENGNITIEDNTLLSDNKLDSLPVGTYIFINNGSKFVKFLNNILKVD